MKVFCAFAVLFITAAEFKVFQKDERNNYKEPRNMIPDHIKYAEMARYIMHEAEWVSMGTISSFPGLEGYPFVNILSTADGPRRGKSTGVPYLYITERDFSGNDLKNDNRLTLMVTMDQNLYCKHHQLDPMDPRCARVMICGKITKLVNGMAEYEFAQNSLFQRHPTMKNWPTDHGFFIVKVDIATVLVLDWFGGPRTVSPEDYFKADPYQFEKSLMNIKDTERNIHEKEDFELNNDSNKKLSIKLVLAKDNLEERKFYTQILDQETIDKDYNNEEINQIIVVQVL